MKFEPNYEISHKILELIKGITKLSSMLDNQNISNTISTQFKEKVKVKNSLNTLSITNKQPKIDSTLEQEARNYYQLLDRINKFKNEKFDLNLVLLIHKNLFENNKNNILAGKIRKIPVNYKDKEDKKTIYTPPNHKDVKNLLKSLLEYVEYNKDIDPLILAGIFHKQFLLISPFEDGNIRSAQILTRILLIKMNFNISNLLNFENHYKNDQEKYFKEAIALGNYYKIKNKLDFTKWLEYFTDMTLSEVKKLKKEIEEQKSTQEVRLNKDQEKLLNYVKKHGSINDNDYAKITKRKKSTRVVDYNKLIDLGLIERRGRARQTYYILKN